MIPDASILGLRRYVISSEEFEMEFVITAKNPQQAWRKFIAQRFGALKPNRSDWTVKIQK